MLLFWCRIGANREATCTDVGAGATCKCAGMSDSTADVPHYHVPHVHVPHVHMPPPATYLAPLTPARPQRAKVPRVWVAEKAANDIREATAEEFRRAVLRVKPPKLMPKIKRNW